MGNFRAAALLLSATVRGAGNGTVERHASPCQTGVACPIKANPRSKIALSKVTGSFPGVE